MKRTPLKRKTPLRARKLPSTRSKLRKSSSQRTSTLKREIQAILRQTAILRDGGCVLRHFPEAGTCSGALQAEHLRSRTFNSTFADMRNIVCLCQRHHIWWKPQNSRLYWELIEKIIGKKRWEWLKRAEKDTKTYRMGEYEWSNVLAGLEQELKKL